jgi:hypothetical protein
MRKARNNGVSEKYERLSNGLCKWFLQAVRLDIISHCFSKGTVLRENECFEGSYRKTLHSVCALIDSFQLFDWSEIWSTNFLLAVMKYLPILKTLSKALFSTFSPVQGSVMKMTTFHRLLREQFYIMNYIGG